MEYSELSQRMVDVLGISLARLLAETQKGTYDRARDNSTDKFPAREAGQMQQRARYDSNSGSIFARLVSRYRKLENGEEIFLWKKCPQHGTFLQPEYKPFPHWQCWYWQGCAFARPAKFRTKIERDIFALARYLDEKA